VSTAPVLAELPDAFLPLVPETHLLTAVVAPYERALLYVNGELARVLSEGRYAVLREHRDVRLVRVDLREREIQIAGQEVMTADKVSLRINVVVKLRVVDPVASVQGAAALDDALYSEAQLVARRHVAGLSVDQLLERRGEAAAAMREALAPRAQAWGVEVIAIDLKDVILPGDMKALLNRVIEAEKQAAATSILRREETAATRSLANTAKLLEQNPTLMRLKEMEAWRDMAGRVGQITVVATPQQLLSAVSIKG
jgi:regulator of protease activity HflC (stomatin/prohibitin superfamily)